MKAGRTLAFLKIFVADDEEQLDKLEAISTAMPSAHRKTKAKADASASMVEPRKRRSRKNKDNVETGSEPPPNPVSALETASERVVPSDGDQSDPASDEPSAAPKPDKKKTGSKSTAAE